MYVCQYLYLHLHPDISVAFSICIIISVRSISLTMILCMLGHNDLMSYMSTKAEIGAEVRDDHTLRD